MYEIKSHLHLLKIVFKIILNKKKNIRIKYTLKIVNYWKCTKSYSILDFSGHLLLLNWNKVVLC